MADLAEEKRKRTRSPEHPFVNLETALKRAKQFYDKEQRNAVSLTTAVKDWNYEVGSSGGLQTAATLISFGLLKDEGIGDKRKLQLTPLAFRILLDLRPNSTERAGFVKQAALAPKIHKQLWTKWGASLPSDVEIRHTLTVDWDPPFNPKSVDGFIREYKETIAFAKLNESDQVSPDKKTGYAPKIGDYIQWESNGLLQLEQPTRIRAFSPDGKFAMIEGSETGIPVSELIQEDAPTTIPALGYQPEGQAHQTIPPGLKLASGKQVQEDVFSLKEGRVVLQWPTPLSAESVQDVKDWLKIVERKLERAVPVKDGDKV
jgi:hypothetical protein